MKTPHILLASSNVQRMRTNLLHVLDAPNQRALEAEIEANVRSLFELGSYHQQFALGLPPADWRQAISRLYYGAYNCVRASRFCENGSFSTDSTDHKKVSELPTGFPNSATYSIQLPILRDDRNMCDYDHSATEGDLAIAVPDSKVLVASLVMDARTFLAAKGIVV